MEKKKHIVEIVATYVKDRPTAEAIVERLQDEGVLHLGYGKAEIDQIVGTFKEEFNISVVTARDRQAANRLASTHGAKPVVEVIKLLAKSSSGQYAPTVNNVQQLEQKWVSVINYLRKNIGRESEVIEV